MITQPQPTNLTSGEKILISACGLALDKTDARFTLEDLCERAWLDYPEDFRLTGYPQYPDSQRVQSKIYGSIGLVQRGMLEFIETKVLCVTPAGRARVKKLYEACR